MSQEEQTLRVVEIYDDEFNFMMRQSLLLVDMTARTSLKKRIKEVYMELAVLIENRWEDFNDKELLSRIIMGFIHDEWLKENVYPYFSTIHCLLIKEEYLEESSCVL